jgi:hypothetical protein
MALSAAQKLRNSKITHPKFFPARAGQGSSRLCWSHVSA